MNQLVDNSFKVYNLYLYVSAYVAILYTTYICK